MQLHVDAIRDIAFTQDKARIAELDDHMSPDLVAHAFWNSTNPVETLAQFKADLGSRIDFEADNEAAARRMEYFRNNERRHRATGFDMACEHSVVAMPPDAPPGAPTGNISTVTVYFFGEGSKVEEAYFYVLSDDFGSCLPSLNATQRDP